VTATAPQVAGGARRVVSVVVPAYNEAATIRTLLKRVRAQSIDGVGFEIIVVNDGSRDGTSDVLRAEPALYDKLIEFEINGGKGAAVRAALEVATGDYVLFQDADLEYDPDEYAALLVPVLRFGADVVIGSRMIGSRYTRVHYFWHRVGNKTITFLFNLLHNTTFTDIYSCYLLYRRNLLDPLRLVSNGWEQHAEILSRVVERASEIYEVPISYRGRSYAEGKKIRARHAIGVLWMILRRRFALRDRS
jgi:glycosyltransferase involved in cell wall biosynthesis